MSDTNLTPATATVAKPKRTRNEINQKYLAEYELSDTLVLAARLPERIPLLTLRGWPTARVADYEALGNRLEAAALRAVGRTSARKLDTEEKETARQIMLDALHPIRVGAKRTYRGQGNEAGRDAFYINEPLTVSLERLLFIAGQSLLKITPQPDPSAPSNPAATLPAEITLDGVIPADIQTLTERRNDYIEADEDKNETENARRQAHVTVEQLFLQLRAERLDLQLAADQAFPHTAPNGANEAHRAAFDIPTERPAVE